MRTPGIAHIFAWSSNSSQVALRVPDERVADRIVNSNAILTDAKAWSAELIVVGTRGRGALIHLLLGSVAERVIRHSPVPVLLVGSPEKHK